MRTRGVIIPVIAGLALVAGVLTVTAARRGDRVIRVDFDKGARVTSPAYDAWLDPVVDAPIKEFRIPIKDATLEIAKGVSYQGWTFGGTVPGPIIRVRVGDLVRVTVVNNSPMPHSIDFHAARIPANLAYRMIMPKDSVQFEFIARDAGAFMVHCGTPPVTMHLMQGMYFAFIVDPKDGWGTKADKEFVLVQSELYAKAGDSTKVGVLLPATPDWSAEQSKSASHVAFNGRAFQYKESVLKVDVGDRVRMFVVSAGPNFGSDFHIVGAVFDRVYPDGNPDHALENVQTYHVPAGGGVVFETVFAKHASGEGLYPFVTPQLRRRREGRGRNHSGGIAEERLHGSLMVKQPVA